MNTTHHTADPDDRSQPVSGARHNAGRQPAAMPFRDSRDRQPDTEAQPDSKVHPTAVHTRETVDTKPAEISELPQLDALASLGAIDTGAMVCDANGVCRPARQSADPGDAD